MTKKDKRKDEREEKKLVELSGMKEKEEEEVPVALAGL